jgi:hypothetical protein
MKNLIALILLVTLPLLANSQTLSNDSTCCVPCKSLKKALLVKTERDFLLTQLDISRDSTLLLTQIVTNQDSIISKQDSTIVLYKQNEVNFNQVIKNKDSEIEIKDKQLQKQKTKTKIAWGVAGLNAIALILILL